MPSATPRWTAAEVRASFVQHFANKLHTNVPSSSVVPHEDPTLLFTNAGMNQVFFNVQIVFSGNSDQADSNASENHGVEDISQSFRIFTVISSLCFVVGMDNVRGTTGRRKGERKT